MMACAAWRVSVPAQTSRWSAFSTASLALALDCDECFDISSPTCPACGSATWTSLSRFLAQASAARHQGRRVAAVKRHDDPPEMVRQLIIVADNRAHLYEHLKRGFAGNETVRVLLNRRVVTRRERSGPYEAERRQADRRLPSKIDALLRAIGWAIVPRDDPKNYPRGSAL